MANRIVLAAAGSGKTQRLIEEALKDSQRRVLITTYTNGNADQIHERIRRIAGTLPPNVEIMTWFEFLLREGIKPYQSILVDPFYVHSINFESDRPRYVKRSDVRRYYFDSGANVYRDVVADLACEINRETGGRTVRRLEDVFGSIFIDELQDLVGYDLDFLELLLLSRVSVVAAGDPLQFTYSTNRSARNSQYRGVGLVDWANLQQRSRAAIVETLSVSYRCNQAICDFADRLFPQVRRTVSLNSEVTGHDGIFLVHADDVDAYVREFQPMPLRWDIRSKAAKASGLPAVNIGAVKGCTFPRVLIFPTDPMLRYLQSGSVM